MHSNQGGLEVLSLCFPTQKAAECVGREWRLTTLVGGSCVFQLTVLGLSTAESLLAYAVGAGGSLPHGKFRVTIFFAS